MHFQYFVFLSFLTWLPHSTFRPPTHAYGPGVRSGLNPQYVTCKLYVLLLFTSACVNKTVTAEWKVTDDSAREKRIGSVNVEGRTKKQRHLYNLWVLHSQFHLVVVYMLTSISYLVNDCY